MTNEDLTVLILDKLDWDYDLILNPNRFRDTKVVLAGDCILSILKEGNVTLGAKYLNISYKVLNTCIERTLVPLFGNLNGGGEGWRFKLLDFIQYKECSNCKKMLPYTEYHKDSHSSSGTCHICKECRVLSNAEQYKKEATKKAHRKSYLKNKDKIKARNALYRAQRELRVPSWQNIAEIAIIYKNCPEGMHVDHEVPLKGEVVCGLHVVDNLQYLLAEDNIRKSNSFDIEKFNAGERWYEVNTAPLTPRLRARNISGRKQTKLAVIPCLYCGTEFKPAKFEQSFCSKSCGTKYNNPSAEQINGYTKEYIQTLIWNKPLSIGCKDVGMTDNGLKKMAIRLGCIMPPARYHVKSPTDKQRIKEETFK